MRAAQFVPQYAYTPFGQRTRVAGDLDSDFGFTGHFQHRPSGLYLTIYRAYDPALGRWLSRDPLGEGDDLNLYGYAYNDPVNYFDPFGLQNNANKLTQNLPGPQRRPSGPRRPQARPEGPRDHGEVG